MASWYIIMYNIREIIMDKSDFRRTTGRLCCYDKGQSEKTERISCSAGWAGYYRLLCSGVVYPAYGKPVIQPRKEAAGTAVLFCCAHHNRTGISAALRHIPPLCAETGAAEAI